MLKVSTRMVNSEEMIFSFVHFLFSAYLDFVSEFYSKSIFRTQSVSQNGEYKKDEIFGTSGATDFESSQLTRPIFLASLTSVKAIWMSFYRTSKAETNINDISKVDSRIDEVKK